MLESKFFISFDISIGMDKKEKVYSVLRKIPKGKVATYKAVASACKIHPREAGRIISQNPYAPEVPCHRVIMTDRSIGGYTYDGRQNPEKKIQILKREGIRIDNRKVRKEFLYQMKNI